MKTFMILFCVCLLLFSLIVILRLLHLKHEIRHFAKEVEKLRNSNYAQPLKVSCFDKDIVSLAVKINDHIEIQRSLGIEYENNKKQLGHVISGISHDFRTPLTAALGYLQMLEKSNELSGKNMEYLSIAIQKNKYLKELSDDFFELTKLENSIEELDMENINLSNLVADFVLEQHEWIEKRQISTEFEIEDGIIIETSVHYMMRILGNLMSNARKYTVSSFGVTLKNDEKDIVLRVFNKLQDRNSVDIDKVFEPFYRIDSRTNNGAGLGLYVVRILAEKLGISVNADLNINGVFSIEMKFSS